MPPPGDAETFEKETVAQSTDALASNEPSEYSTPLCAVAVSESRPPTVYSTPCTVEFRPTRRTLLRTAREERSNNPFDFVLENPLDGSLKDLPCIRALVQRHGGSKVFEHPTSYCHFDAAHRKRTILISTLPALQLPLPCPQRPCCQWRRLRKHQAQVAGMGAAERNSIPSGLVTREVEAWITRTPWARYRLFIDVFSGWGSVANHVQTSFDGVDVYANDIVRRTHNNIEFDVTCTRDSLFTLLRFALACTRRDGRSVEAYSLVLEQPNERLAAALRQESIAILFHLSTPCETYSTASGSYHRSADRITPKTDMARRHDAMNAALVAWLLEHVV